MKRIQILGTTGCGKTTLGLKLSAALGIPLHDLDDYFWLPGWQKREEDDFRERVRTVVEQDAWIISGNYKTISQMITESADTIIWLDYSFTRNLWQILKRSVLRARNKTSICNGNHEEWRKLFSRDSIILWFFKSFHDKRRRYRQSILEWEKAGKTYFHLKSPAETKAFLEKAQSLKA